MGKKREGPLEAVVVVLFLTDGSRHPFYFHRKNRRPTSRPGRRHTHTRKDTTPAGASVVASTA